MYDVSCKRVEERRSHPTSTNRATYASITLCPHGFLKVLLVVAWQKKDFEKLLSTGAYGGVFNFVLIMYMDAMKYKSNSLLLFIVCAMVSCVDGPTHISC